MLHAGKSLCHLRADLVRHHVLHRSKGCQVIEHIVLSGQMNLRCGQHSPTDTVVHAVQYTVFQHGSLLDLLSVRKPGLLCLRAVSIVCAVLVIQVQNQAAVFGLSLGDAAFGIDVILKVLVLIQMIRCEVGDDGNIRTAGHTVQLKGAKFQNRNVVRLNIRGLTKQRIPDVSAQVHPVTGGL